MRLTEPHNFRNLSMIKNDGKPKPLRKCTEQSTGKYPSRAKFDSYFQQVHFVD